MTILLTKKKIESGLEGKGFSKKKGSHIRFVYYYKNGKKGPVSHFSHGARGDTVSKGLVSTMARQLKVSAPEFIDLVECPLTRDGYESILVQRNGKLN